MSEKKDNQVYIGGPDGGYFMDSGVSNITNLTEFKELVFQNNTLRLIKVIVKHAALITELSEGEETDELHSKIKINAKIIKKCS